jgi:hypothetical protein
MKKRRSRSPRLPKTLKILLINQFKKEHAAFLAFIAGILDMPLL